MTQRTYSDTLYQNYLKEVEDSGLLRSADEVPPSNGGDLEDILKRSRALFRREFANCHGKLIELFNQIGTIEKEIKADIASIKKECASYDKHWNEVFDDFNRNLLGIFDYAQEKLIGSFAKKVKRMDNFVICLFGRTKAGKSTTMEALTWGDGTSIGTGRQNTTQDTKEYIWKGLIVVDTPGIDAMDKKQELETKALNFADDADLIFFLMPHQIEEGDFDKFERFYLQNKPIVIILNKKKEVGKPGTMPYKMFLSHPENVLTSEEIRGYISRIERYVLEKLGIARDLIPVIPVHSQAAFISRTVENGIAEDDRKLLLRTSNFEELEKRLVTEIKEYGELYRIKNPYETVLLFAEQSRSAFVRFRDLMADKQKVFETNAAKFMDVKARIEEKKRGIFSKTLADYFASKRSTVSRVVEDLFAESDESKRQGILRDFISESALTSKIKDCEQQIVLMLKKEIEEFFKNFKDELSAIDVSRYKYGVAASVRSSLEQSESLRNTSDLLEGVSLATSVAWGVGATIVALDLGLFGATGTLFGLGSANFWNPVGWGLLVLSVVTGIFGYKKKQKMKKKLKEAKTEARSKLQKAVDDTQYDINQVLDTYVRQVLDSVQKEHVEVMRRYAFYAKKHLTQVDDLTSFLFSLGSEMQVHKFESMLRRISGEESIRVPVVAEDANTIRLRVQGDIDSKRDLIQRILSRVEEKQVFLDCEKYV